MKPSLHWLCLLFTALELNLRPARAADVQCVFELNPFDAGHYDVYGERDDALIIGRAGGVDARGPYRAYFAFRVLQFTGTLSRAELILHYNYYPPNGDSNATLRINGLTTPVEVVRAGGFTLTDVYADLGDGPVFGEVSLPAICCASNGTAFNSNAFPVILSARGGQFAIGADHASLSTNPAAAEFFYLSPWSVSLRLTVTTPAPPVIHTPLTVEALNSNYLIATVGACGAMPIRYRWFCANGLITEFDSYDAQPVSANIGLGSISVTQSVFAVMSNAFGSVTSQVVQVVPPIAYIGLFQTNFLARAGDSFTVNSFVAPQGPPYYPLFLQWLKHGVPVPGAESPTLSFNNATTNDSGLYTLFASNAAGTVTSGVVRVRVEETRPVFWTQPADTTGALGDVANLWGWAVAGPLPKLQWFRINGTPVSDQTNDFLSLYPLVSSDEGDYYLVASNLLGATTSRVAHISVVLDPPVFVGQTQSVNLFPKNYIYLAANATDTPAPAFQWYFNGAPMPGQNLDHYYISSAGSNDIGSYFCVASNASGVATSAVAVVNVLFVPPVVDGPADITAPLRWPVTLGVLVSNPPAAVTWWFNGSPVQQQTLGDFTEPRVTYLSFSNAEPSQAGHYWLVASNAFGVTTSRVATLTLTGAPPALALGLSPSEVIEGATVQLFAEVSGAPFPGVRLYHQGLLIPPFSNLVWRLPTVTLADSGAYIAIATNLLGTAMATQYLTVQRAGPLDRWTLRNPIPQGNELFAVTFGQGRFVAVGKNGAIINSTDGTNWNLRSLTTTADLLDVAYGNGWFVAVGENGLIISSTNGDHWAQQNLPVPWLYGVTYGDGRFVAVGQRTPYTAVPALWTSTNAVDWVDASDSFPTASFLRGVAYGPPGFVAVDAYQGDYQSTDLLNWNSGTTNVYDPESVRFLNGRYIAVGSGGAIAVSLNGVAWTKVTFGTRRLYDVAFGGGQYVVVGNKGDIRRSSDALNWSAPVNPTTDRLQGVAYGNGLFVAVGEVGNIFTSADGVAWANQLRGSGEDLDGLEVANGLAVAVGKNDTLLTSTDGTTWTRQNIPSTNSDWYSVAYGDGKWVVVGESTNILVSTNGLDWEARPVALSYTYLKGVVYAQGRWVVVGEAARIMSSLDTITWTTNYSPVPYDLNEITYGNGLYVIAGDHGTDPQATILTSANGIDWENRTVLTGKNARGIAFANGTFIVPFNDGGILYGTNPVNTVWNYAATGVTGEGRNLRGGTWSNGFWVVVGNDGRLLTTVATNQPHYWRSRITPTLENLHAVRWINHTFIAVGNQGVILQSDPLETRFSVEREGNNLRLIFSSPWEAVLIIQHSTNFNWTPFQWFSNAFGIYEQVVPLPPGPAREFFRVVTP